MKKVVFDPDKSALWFLLSSMALGLLMMLFLVLRSFFS